MYLAARIVKDGFVVVMDLVVSAYLAVKGSCLHGSLNPDTVCSVARCRCIEQIYGIMPGHTISDMLLADM